MAALPRIRVDERHALAAGPQMDRAVWYALRRLPRHCHPLQAWPTPLPWSTDMQWCYDLMTWLTRYPLLGKSWSISLTYEPFHHMSTEQPSGKDWHWSCTIRGPGFQAWEVDGEGATPMAAFCRAFLWELPFPALLPGTRL